MPEPIPQDSHSEVRRIIDAAREVWIRRLIDHSRSNSLLFYRDLKVGTLDITDKTVAISRLVAGEALTVDALIPIFPRTNELDPISEKNREEAQRNVRSALIALQRKALSNLEEKGIMTLFLAMNIATWPASDGGRPFEAPVLLLPASIEAKGRSGEDIRLSVAGEPQINPVLIYILEENYGVRISASDLISECGDEDELGQWRVNANQVASKIEEAGKKILEFQVKPRAIIANFQFAKMAMVEDLKKNVDVIASSELVAAIAGDPHSRQNLAASVADIELKELDERPASDDYLVLDADSTQHRATVLVSRGQSGVVQGPPGTGKSQTIANIIAQSVADGRRVLFVAEKRAALDAVIKRLAHSDVGLGHLILDLHGASVSRKEVMSRLACTLDHIRHAPPVEGVEAVHREFETRRQHLNEHARRMNVIRKPTGFSVHQLIGKILVLPATARSTHRIRGATLESLTPERFSEIRSWIHEGAANSELLLGRGASPWNAAKIADGQDAQIALDCAKDACDKIWPSFAGLLNGAVDELGIKSPRTLDEIAQLLELFRDTEVLRDNYDEGIFSAQSIDLAEDLEPAAGNLLARSWSYVTNSRIRDARRRMLSFRNTRASLVVLSEEAVLVKSVISRWNSLRTNAGVPNSTSRELSSSFSSLNDAVQKLRSITRTGTDRSAPLEEIAAWLFSLASDQRTPYLLPKIDRIKSQLKSVGLSAVLGDFAEHGVEPADWVYRFEYIWLYSALEKELASDPALAGFKGQTHEELIEDFSRLDRERLKLAAHRVRRLHGERSVAAMNRHFDQSDLVKREAAKRSRHLALRELFSRAPDVLTQIAPCWVASPLSVSQLLDGGKRHFDLVVFDEASQVLQEEAIPAIYRADQVVVAGDRHQLPPTTFFATAVEGEDDVFGDDETRDAHLVASAAIGGFESLLGTMEAFLPNWLLEWHYRSEDERLITFSNTNVYSGRLVTFPSARGHEAIRHVLVPHDSSLGAQEESASREVQEVIRQIISHAQELPSESLGVITMGIKHANRIQAELDRTLALRSELKEFFSLDKEERFFIKNLETVQGDERDAIILSIGYGKNPNGDLPHMFGPLTQEVGYRRLNVAVTRAKRRICVVSSFSSNEIDLNRSGSRGVQLLKAYLEYAANGGQKMPQQERAGEVALNAFEADVRDAIESHGVITRPQFGASRYRIDLVAMHPNAVGRPVLAIECDGASYHSSSTARDRDRLRQEHLQRLGWRFHRIWSTDWFYSRESEIHRLLESYKQAVRDADSLTIDSSMTVPPTEPSYVVADSKKMRGARPKIRYYASIDYYDDRELIEIAKWIASDGLLRTDEEMIREIFSNLDFARLGSRIRTRLSKIARRVNNV